MLKRALQAMLWLGVLAGCATAQQEADTLAGGAALARTRITTAPFLLTGYVRLTRPDAPLHVYIEGDGQAWLDRYTPSSDPTPRRPIGLMLAAADRAPNVLYLARPCQYTPMADNPACTAADWTGRRFAPEVIDSLDQAISQYAPRARGIELIGYSGGGALAVLLAARRHDVRTLRTVAGNLDHDAVNRLHGVSPMPESANAIDVAHQVSGIAQWHFSGADDRTVPPGIAARFAAAAGGHCIHLRTLAGMTHGGDWAAYWPALLALTPRCDAP